MPPPSIRTFSAGPVFTAAKLLLPVLFLLAAFIAFKNAPHIYHELPLAKMDGGESLLHGIPAPVFPREMPLASVAAAFLQNHAARKDREDYLAAGFVLCLLCFASLSSLLQNPFQGWLSFALLSAFWAFGAGGAVTPDLEQLLYSAALAACAAALAAAFRSPSRLTWALAGSALAMSLLVRSTMFLFPALLAAAGLFPVLRRFPAPKPAHFAVLFAAPLLVIGGWFYMNKAVFSRSVFLESARAHSNMITGALGVVSTIEGDAYKLAGLTPEDNIPAWAAGEIARHPFRYAVSVLRRLGTVLSRHLLLLAAALAGFWFFRADRGFRALGALALYFLLIHCSMSVEERYFVPFWALLIPAAAAPLAPLTEKLRAFYGEKRSAALHAAPFLPLAALSLFVLGLVLLYPARARSRPPGPDTMTALLAAHPLDPWLHNKLGGLYLGEGRSAAAAAAFGRAYELSGNDEYLSSRALALMSAGAYGEMNSLFSAHDAGYKGMLVRMLYELKTGKTRDAAATFRSAGERHLKETCYLRDMQGPYEAGIYSKLLGSDTRLRDIHLTALLRLLPFEERLGLLEGLSAIGLDEPSFEIMLELQGLGRYAEAKKIAGRLVAGSPGDPDYLKAAGVLECLSGDLQAGAELLRRAIRASPDYIPSYLSLAAVYHRSGRLEESARVYRDAAERCRDDSEVCRAARELAAGDHSR